MVPGRAQARVRPAPCPLSASGVRYTVPTLGLLGHLWTVVPSVRHDLFPRSAPPAEPWSTTFHDPRVGTVTLTGHLREEPDADTVLIVAHGLGGEPDSHYCVAAARAAARRGWSCLRMALRGADRKGTDFYHAGLTADLEAALGSRALAGYRRALLVGFSLGGHVVLRYGLAPADPRVRGVAAVCAPLDLNRSGAAIDAPDRVVYRRHVLAGLVEIYEGVAARSRVPIPVEMARRIRTIREWDRLTVAPHHGFHSVDDYYNRMSVGPRLGAMQLPALVVPARHDPMVPASTVADYLEQPGPAVTVRWLERGGHVGYPRVDLGEGTRGGVEDEVLAWLDRQ